jgi:hypothetical protein
VTSHIAVAFTERLRNQADVFSRRQALSGGYAPSAIDARVRRGSWRTVHPGVYTTAGGELSEHGLLWAVVLYAGRGALLSHETAAWLHGFSDKPAGLIHVTIPVDRRVREPRGVRVHRAVRVVATATREDEPPRTKIEETVLDLLNESASVAEARDWMARAIEAGLTDREKLVAAALKRKKLRWRAEISPALLPFNGAGRLAGDVQHDAVDLGDLVGDADGNALEHVGR